MKLQIKSRIELLKQIRKPLPKPGISFRSRKDYDRSNFKRNWD